MCKDVENKSTDLFTKREVAIFILDELQSVFQRRGCASRRCLDGWLPAPFRLIGLRPVDRVLLKFTWCVGYPPPS